MRADTPLKAIAYFDAVMRSGSTTTAAEKLFVTPGAVGQQVRKLEAWLGVQLFIRHIRKLEPTQHAIRYWEQVKPALQQIEEANSVVMGRRTREVRISLPPALASSWFARRMPEFVSRHPDLSIHLNASSSKVDLDSGEYDMGVRHFDGQDEGIHSHLLLKDEARVYCSAGYQKQCGLRAPVDIIGATLLYTTSHAHWSRWLALAGLSFDGMSRPLRFDQSEVAIDAARRGQGLVLTSPWLVEDDVQAGRLIQAFPQCLKTGKGYYLVASKHLALSDAARIVWEWLTGTAQVACLPAT
ncbi:LysR family transcriptional regulator [Pseudomonas sp. S31]|uniref:LysR substrate-binding domain-containing protein n=1 Tax=Pseudomonas sp. S31 TaxID=1564473 RepID=UPI001F18CCF4|nr:LysR substrate-binding domain-containing protein [Pseudomonas sp. S31]MBK5001842.1 LysR family transcriptional regulator [Pseudomonas sp. S31]